MSRFNQLKKSLLYKILINENIEKRLPVLHKQLFDRLLPTWEEHKLLFQGLLLEMEIENYKLYWRISLDSKYDFFDDEANSFPTIGGGVSFEKLHNETGYVYSPGGLYNGLNPDGGYNSATYEFGVDRLDDESLIGQLLKETNKFLNTFNDVYLTEFEIFINRLKIGYNEGVIASNCPQQIIAAYADDTEVQL